MPAAAKNVEAATVNENDLLNQLLDDDFCPLLPPAKQPSKCPLFCCFYAEFDIKVGPMICFQSPLNFMDQDINISTEKIHDILSNTFHSLDAQNATSANPEAVHSQHSGDLGPKEADHKENSLPEGGLSVFDSTSEYIITGSELTGKIITLSTHDMHVMTRPTLISDARYERNALLFSVGIVLRRAADPRPFRPLISKLATQLRSMEIESHFLSKPSLRKQLQPLLERILVSLNSSQWECNLLLSRSNALNLKLFHPPKPESSPVHDHEVPILLRRDLQLQMYDWDLSINWVILHIDGVTNARQISIKAEVDLEMVRACLRVLKHHGVIALVDMFMYSNRYEFTEKATAMLAGKEPKLLQEASDFVSKRPATSVPPQVLSSEQVPPSAFGGGGSGSDSSQYQQNGSPYPQSLSTSYPPRTLNLLGASQRSSTFRYAMMAAQSFEKESSIGSRREEQPLPKAALAELYCTCSRNVSFGDLWMSLTTESPTSLALPNLTTSQGKKPTLVNRQRPKPGHKIPILEEFSENEPSRDPIDCVAFSPLEAIQLEALRKTTNGQKTMDWNDFFKRFDHRRFLTFGVIHGLLKRIHNYPYFPGVFPERNVVAPNDASVKSDLRHNLKTEFVEEKSYVLARKIASLMDGAHCDDELVCMFEKPFNQLVELVEKFGGRKIVSVFAPSPDE